MDERDKKNALKKGTILKSKERNYTIEQVLGAGGFGITYKVSAEIQVGNVPMKLFFAVKEHFLKDTCERDSTGSICYSNPVKEKVEDSRRDFLAEAKRLNKISSLHPNVVRVNEVLETNNTVYYVMEYLDGENLRKYKKVHGAFTEAEAINIITPIAKAVAFLHQNRITHLDIKPDNIMLKSNGEEIIPVLIDFGLAKHYDKKGNATSTVRVTGCSDGYSPLEQYAGITTYMPTADVYALGATLYYLLVGKDPVIATEQTTEKIRQALPQGISEQTCNAILSAMKKEKNERTQTANGFLRNLEKTYTLRLGTKLKSKYSCYTIISLISEADNKIVYKVCQTSSLDESSLIDVTDENATEPVRTFIITEFFLKKQSVRKNNSVDNGNWDEKQIHSSYVNFIDEAKRATGLKEIDDVMEDKEKGRRELFAENGTFYYVMEKKVDEALMKKVKGLKNSMLGKRSGWVLGILIVLSFITYSLYTFVKKPAPVPIPVNSTQPIVVIAVTDTIEETWVATYNKAKDIAMEYYRNKKYALAREEYNNALLIIPDKDSSGKTDSIKMQIANCDKEIKLEQQHIAAEKERQEEKKRKEQAEIQRQKKDKEDKERKERLSKYNLIGKNVGTRYQIVQRKVDRKWGIIDKDGNIKVACVYEQANMQELIGNHVALKRNEGWDVFDANASKIVSGLKTLDDFKPAVEKNEKNSNKMKVTLKQ